jgi:para-aminobenzoate synthetase
MKCLILDNYDSFTWNLGDYVCRVFGSEPLIVRNDAMSWQALCERGGFDAVIVSPGPGTVENPADLNASRDALAQDRFPVFGVCLGFQGLAAVYGGGILRAPVPYHGRRSHIRHDGIELFAGIPDGFQAVRYHSLMVDAQRLPACLMPTATSDDGLLMALRHRSLPKWGVQFHPESILTEHGIRIVRNFRDLAAAHLRIDPAPRASAVPVAIDLRETASPPRRQTQVIAHPLRADVSAEAAFLRLYAKERNAFWLDSQSIIAGMSRFSFMGAVADDAVHACSAHGEAAAVRGDAHFDAIERLLESVEIVEAAPLPFAFRGGVVGFLSYEAKALFGEATTHANPHPDSVWMHVERFLAFDHVAGRAWAVAVCEPAQQEAAERWVAATQAVLAMSTGAEARTDRASAGESDIALSGPLGAGVERLDIRLAESIDGYLAAIAQCKRAIVAGESYEVCLTNAFSFRATLDPLALYLTMRAENPAPFGAFLRVGGVAMLSTSPERLFQVDADGVVQSKPIKGSCARSADAVQDRDAAERLAQSEKDRAENLMIVDLIRNDLARVSEAGSIAVPKLMDIESYATIHQMVSTVQSRLKPESTLVDLLRAVYPGGSITGAPKIRTMEIIDRLETVPRGIYCGSIGYLGYGRVADLNIAIRTLSYDGETVRFGAGGAITYLSDPVEECEEMLLKADALLKPIWSFLDRHGSEAVRDLSGAVLRLGRPSTL